MYFKKVQVLMILFFVVTSMSCQDYGKLKVQSDLPKLLKEVSGIELCNGSELIWMINDSGNSTEVYGYDLNTQKIKTVVTLKGVVNNDWEDLASDTQGNIYVGDFGNNSNERKNLSILKFKPNLEDTTQETTPRITRFSLSDQTKFPPNRKNRNFDVESFFYFENNFYLFTRNRSSKFDGVTKIYRVPASEGNVTANLIGSFKTCDNSTYCQVTSATINHNTGMIAILSYNKVWLLDWNPNEVFSEEKIKKIALKYKSQKESITFLDNNTLLIADEKSRGRGGKLYTYTIK